MTKNRVPEFPYLLAEWFDQIPRQQRLTPIYLGGTGGGGGGAGQPPGGFIGKLPQRYIAYDTDQFALTSGSASLVDNLNHIRYWEKPARWFEAHQGNPIQNRVLVEPGIWTHTANAQPLIFAGGYSPTFTSGSVPHVDVLYLNTSGSLVWSTSASTTPSYPAGTVLPIWEVYIRSSGNTYDADQGTNNYLLRDVRPFLNNGSATSGSATVSGTPTRIPYFNTTTSLSDNKDFLLTFDTTGSPILVLGSYNSLNSEYGFQARIQIISDNPGAGFTSFSFNDTPTFGGFYTLGHSGGTRAAPTPVLSGFSLGRTTYLGQVTSGSTGIGTASARIEAIASENFTTGSQGSYLSFNVTRPTTATLLEVVKIVYNQLLVTHGVPSGTSSIRVNNTDNTDLNSNAVVTISSGGSAGGDPFIDFNVNGDGDSSLGIDNSDSNKLKFSNTVGISGSGILWSTTRNGGWEWTPAAVAAGEVAVSLTAAAHTAVVAELVDVKYNLGRTVTFTHASVPATQRAFEILKPTYATSSLTDTITSAATLYIDAAPAAGTGITITNAYALWVDAGLSQFDGGIQDATLTAGRVAYTGANGRLVDSANLVFNGNQLALATSGSTGGVLIGTDALLYRSAAGVFRTTSHVIVDGGISVGVTSLAGTGNILVNGLVTAAQVNASGLFNFTTDGIGSGIIGGAVGDVQLYRSAADMWRTPDSMTVDGALNVGSVTGAPIGAVYTSGSIASRVDGITGGLFSGSASDVQIYRSAADTWRTPDSLTVDVGLNVGSTSSAPAGVVFTSGSIYSRVDGIGGGFAAGAGGAIVQLYRSAADMWRTPDGLTVDLGLNIGSGSGAASGSIALSGDISGTKYAVTTSGSPTWTATTTNPVLGNGSLEGRWVRLGDTVHFWVMMTAGTTTTFGTGAWEFTVPVAAATPPRFYIGAAQILDSGVADYIGVVRLDQNTGKIRIITATGSASVIIPHAWGNGDVLAFYITYRVS